MTACAWPACAPGNKRPNKHVAGTWENGHQPLGGRQRKAERKAERKALASRPRAEDKWNRWKPHFLAKPGGSHPDRHPPLTRAAPPSRPTPLLYSAVSIHRQDRRGPTLSAARSSMEATERATERATEPVALPARHRAAVRGYALSRPTHARRTGAARGHYCRLQDIAIELPPMKVITKHSRKPPPSPPWADNRHAPRASEQKTNFKCSFSVLLNISL